MNQVSNCMGASKTNSGGNGATTKYGVITTTTGGSIPGK